MCACACAGVDAGSPALVSYEGMAISHWLKPLRGRAVTVPWSKGTARPRRKLVPVSNGTLSCLLSVQVAWVLAYTTAANEAYLNRLVLLGFVQTLVERLAA